MRACRPGESALLLLDAIDLLDRLKIGYAVIGAMAVSVHGVVRASLDADAVITLPAHRLPELEREFRAAGFRTELRHGEAGDPIGAVLVLEDQFDNQVDLLAGLEGMSHEAFQRTIAVPFEGRALRVVGREDLIAMKLYAGGPQDLLDAEGALAAGGATVDIGLLRRIAGGFGSEAVLALEQLLGRGPRNG